jgi:sensor histidine kinase YesM
MGEFSKLIRQTLNNSSKQKINLADEIKYLQTYIRLENMRFKNAIAFKWNCTNDIDTHEVLIPPMLLQPFIENVFVHAFDNQSVNPTLEVTFKIDDAILICEIKDNGKGMSTENINKLNHSKGIGLVKERITLFQKDIVEPVTINSILNKGTTVIIKLQINF